MQWFAERLLGKAMWFSVGVMTLALIEGHAVGQCELTKLLASDGAAGDHYGHSVSISGAPGNEVTIVGSWLDDDNGMDSGSAYIYRKSGAIWIQETKLLAADGAMTDYFGYSVSISGTPGNEVAIVGAWADDDNGSGSGSAYIYRFNGVSWVEEDKLLASDGTGGNWFGYSVSISGTSGNEVAIVGAVHDDDNGLDSGSVYIYRINPDTSGWVEEQKLLASDGAAIDHFAYSVSINGDVAIAGAYRDDDNGSLSGSAYVYRFNGVSWDEEVKLLASDGSMQDYFGTAVSIRGTPGTEVAIVGAREKAYIYRFDGLSWIEEQKLISSDGAGRVAGFGGSVSISGSPGNEVTIVGASRDKDSGTGSGSAYIYRKNGASWVEQEKILAPDGAAGDRFGLSVAISGPSGNEFAIVGADQDDDSGSFSGSAYIFELTACAADTNCSGEVDVTDLLALLAGWGPCPAHCAADLNNDGNVNVTDLLALIAAWGSYPGHIADINGDGNVNVTDLLALLAAWGSCTAPSPCAADSNNDGQVNVTDLLAILAAWGPCP